MALSDKIHLTGTLAARPAAAANYAGTLYRTTDQSPNVVYRCDGAAWNVFAYGDGTAGSGGITALTGDVTASGSGSVAASLAASGVTAGSYGDATHVPQVSVDAKGRVTSASNVAISGGSVFGGSGSGHSTGIVPDPGATAGTTRYLREDATWAAPAGGGGGGPSILLDYAANTDLWNNGGVVARTWTDLLGSAQNFTTTKANAVVAISLNVNLILQYGSSTDGTINTSSRLNVDSGTTKLFGGMVGTSTISPNQSNAANPFAGGSTVFMTIATPGNHTVMPQFNVAQSGIVAFCRANSSPDYEFVRIQVLQY